ncbi:hypothetical protein [Ruminococcus sp.]|uniref:DUF6935 domain-containing protein n=1 Tax=Ruminococcus sp. TaxID=41978 RepID=UPI00260D3D31|nr:hypothetical protein [Ruminococcus sp.]MDD6989766.1 hypothetical protein [Ruminococcus sp.]MDY6202763.1 hypothetical protein [Ruminococcus sp.]
MGLFDMFAGKAANQLGNAVKQTVQSAGNKTEKIVFGNLPESYEQFTALPQASLSTPFQTAAMTVLAFCFYPKDSELCYRMIDFLRGPRPMNGSDKSFIADRFRDKDYVPRSYFAGATPSNDYQPVAPYTISVSENRYSYDEQGIAKLFIKSGGADDPRPIKLRKAKDGKWYLWEYSSILLGIRQPESSNPWA